MPSFQAAFSNTKGGASGPSSSPSIDLCIVRHGATEMNNQTDLSEDRIRAWLDVPLAPEGREEAKRAIGELEPEDIELIVCSDLKRAEETASIISHGLHLPYHPTTLLRPWNLGDFTGKPTKEVLPQLRTYVCGKPSAPVPGGESFNTFCHRAARGLRYAIEMADGRKLCIVTHHRDERFFFAWQKAGFKPSLAVDFETFLAKGEEPGAVMSFSIPQSVVSRIGAGAGATS